MLLMTEEQAKKYGCCYCDERHSICGHTPTPNGSCKGFVLGRCFRCLHRLANNGEFVEGICDDVNDYGGCRNFKE